MRLITPIGIMSRFNLTQKQLDLMVANRSIPFVQLPSIGIRFDEHAIANWIRAQGKPSVDEPSRLTGIAGDQRHA